MSLFPKKINGASCPVARARGAPGAFCPACTISSKISNNYHTRNVHFITQQNYILF